MAVIVEHPPKRRAAFKPSRACYHRIMARHLAAVVVPLALVASCHLIAEVDGLVANEPCETAATCQNPDICHHFTCESGLCTPNPDPVGTVCIFGYCNAASACQCPISGCPVGAPCTQHIDCASEFCEAQQCKPSPCGGPCGGVCWECSVADDACVPVPYGTVPNDSCPDGCDGEGNCQSCDNEVKDVDESDVNCGGPSCPACDDGAMCNVPADCHSCLCENGLCEPFDCKNGLRDGCESDVDCGGPCGSTCAPGEYCHSKQDCASHFCSEGVCQEEEAR